MGDEGESKPVFESFSLMCDETLQQIKSQDKAFQAAEAALLANMTLRGFTRGGGDDAAERSRRESEDGADEEGEEEPAEVVSDMAFSLMCDEAQQLVLEREKEAEAALAAAELEAYDIFDRRNGASEKEEEDEASAVRGVPNKVAAGCVVVQRPPTAKLVRVAPCSKVVSV